MRTGESWGEMAATECGEIPRGVCRFPRFVADSSYSLRNYWLAEKNQGEEIMAEYYCREEIRPDQRTGEEEEGHRHDGTKDILNW